MVLSICLPSLVHAFIQLMFPECVKQPQFWIVLENNCLERGWVSLSILRVKHTSALRARVEASAERFPRKSCVYPGFQPPLPPHSQLLFQKIWRKDEGLTHQLNPLKSQLSPTHWTEHQPESHIHDMVKRNLAGEYKIVNGTDNVSLSYCFQNDTDVRIREHKMELKEKQIQNRCQEAFFFFSCRESQMCGMAYQAWLLRQRHRGHSRTDQMASRGN